MTVEEAKEYANTMSYEDAVYNALQGRAVPYKKATKIKLDELLEKAKELDELKRKEQMSQEVTPQFAIDYLLDDCEDCPEYKDGECVTESHCFEVKQMCIKALRGELKGEQK